MFLGTDYYHTHLTQFMILHGDWLWLDNNVQSVWRMRLYWTVYNHHHHQVFLKRQHIIQRLINNLVLHKLMSWITHTIVYFSYPLSLHTRSLYIIASPPTSTSTHFHSFPYPPYTTNMQPHQYEFITFEFTFVYA